MTRCGLFDAYAFKKSATDAATEFNKMSPTQASNLLSNLPLKDQVTVMLGMTQAQRAAIMDKMQSKDAAKLFEALQTIPSDITDDNLPQVTAQLNKLDATQTLERTLQRKN
jgi:flagellar motility protein MotE (MotC chaperone)